MKAETLIDADRLRVIRKLCHLVESIPGDAIEVGVYKGGSLPSTLKAKCAFPVSSLVPWKR